MYSAWCTNSKHLTHQWLSRRYTDRCCSAIVQVLEQETAFDGLQWFQSVGAQYNAEAAQVADQSPSKRLPAKVAPPPPPPPPLEPFCPAG